MQNCTLFTHFTGALEGLKVCSIGMAEAVQVGQRSPRRQETAVLRPHRHATHQSANGTVRPRIRG